MIRKVDSAGVIVTLTLAGTHASTGYTGDGGPGLVAQLNNPAFPLIDVSTVTLYFSDVSNFTVRSLGAASGLNFGNQSVTTTSAELPAELFNAALGTGGIASITVTGDFAVTNTGTCSTTTTLVAGASCTVYVTFTPAATGPRTGTLSIAGGVNGTQNLALAGIGQALPVDTTTTLASSKNPALTTDALTLTATVAPVSGTAVPTGTVDFKNGTTSLGTANVGATGTATLSGVTFNAGGTYSLTASYSGDANFNASTSTVLSQVVNAPDFSISTNPTSLSIMRGGSGSATVTITPADGFTGAVTVTCSGAPVNTTCALNPSTINVTAGAATGTLTITTNTQAQLTLPGDGTMLASRHSNPKSFPLSILLGTGVIGMVLAAGSGKLLRPGARGQRLLGIFLLALVFACVLLIPSCSGSSGPKSPTGTSTITVTATSGSITHSTQVSVDIHN